MKLNLRTKKSYTKNVFSNKQILNYNKLGGGIIWR